MRFVLACLVATLLAVISESHAYEIDVSCVPTGASEVVACISGNSSEVYFLDLNGDLMGAVVNTEKDSPTKGKIPPKKVTPAPSKVPGLGALRCRFESCKNTF